MPKETIKNFIMNRFNNSLAKIGMETIFEVDTKLLKKVEWFDIEIMILCSTNLHD